jgi:hypothetical protein
MTTIVYDLQSKRIACDGRVTQGDEIITDEAEKRLELDNIEFFFAGDVGSFKEVAEAFVKKTHKIRKGVDAQALAWDGLDLFDLSADKGVLSWHPVVARRGSIGGGASYAAVALDSGCTPKQAVLAAIKKHIGTGGKVRCYRLRLK